MIALLDLLPVVVFFVAYHIADLFVATAAAMGVTAAQVGWRIHRGGRVDRLQWAGLLLIMLFGGATLLMQNPVFVKWKPSALYWSMGAALWFSVAILRRNLIQALLGERLDLGPTGWRVLNLAWIAFFSFMGLLNLYVALTYPTSTWVWFKLVGGLGLTAMFVLIQAWLLARHASTGAALHPQPGRKTR